MFKELLVVGLGAAFIATLVGCDAATLSKMTPDAARVLVASQGLQGGDLVMDQVGSQDRLRDGTGVNCSNPGIPGSCDGSGPNGSGGYGNRNGGGYGAGRGGADRVRDGSCGG